MWEKVKSFFLHSSTMAFGYAVGFISLVFETTLDATDILGSQEFKDQVSQLFANHPAVVARIGVAISILVIIARLRGILALKRPKKDGD